MFGEGGEGGVELERDGGGYAEFSIFFFFSVAAGGVDGVGAAEFSGGVVDRCVDKLA